MIKRNDEMLKTVKKQMRGGDGEALVTNILEQGEYKGKARLVGTIKLEPGSSIGEHLHDNEEEIFYVIEGEAEYYDDGKTETLKTGDSCLCLGGQRHSIANRGTETLVIMAIILTY